MTNKNIYTKVLIWLNILLNEKNVKIKVISNHLLEVSFFKTCRHPNTKPFLLLEKNVFFNFDKVMSQILILNFCFVYYVKKKQHFSAFLFIKLNQLHKFQPLTSVWNPLEQKFN